MQRDSSSGVVSTLTKRKRDANEPLMSSWLNLKHKFSDIHSDLEKVLTGTGNVKSLLQDLVDIIADSALHTTYIKM
jgi:hypothetical protein